MARSTRTKLVAGGVLAFALVGCTSETSAPADPATDDGAPLSLNEQFVLYRDDATSDFERDVLDRAVTSGSIAAGDYAEAVERYLACTEEAGHTIEAVMQSNGVYRWEPQSSVDDSTYLEDTTACGLSSGLASIEALYKLQVANPTGLPQDDAVVACLREAGVVDGSYDADAFAADAAAGWEGAPYDVTDPAATTCLTSLGFAVGQ